MLGGKNPEKNTTIAVIGGYSGVHARISIIFCIRYSRRFSKKVNGCTSDTLEKTFRLSKCK